jgi:hypothetical protein
VAARLPVAIIEVVSRLALSLWRSRAVWLALGLACVASVGAAQPSAGRAAVLRSTDSATPAAFAEDIDGALLRDLRAIAGIEDPMVSPVEYAEIQLSVGCTDESRACLETMARAAASSALLVRELRTGQDGTVHLELRYFDSASTDPPTAVRREAPSASRDALVAAVPSLVRELFGIPEVAAPAAQPATQPVARSPSQATAGDNDVPIVPWIVIGAGAAALTAGIVVGAVAASDYDAWKKRPIDSMDQAERANDELDDLETRALVANVLMPVGVIALGLGVALLVLDVADDEQPARLDSAPLEGGALVSLRGPW